MELRAFDALEPYEMVADARGTLYVLYRPTLIGPPDSGAALLFEVKDDRPRLLRSFESEVNGLAATPSGVVVLDEDNTVYRYEYEGDRWIEAEDELETPPSPIHTTRQVGASMFGLTAEGTVHVWQPSGWALAAREEDEVFFYDIHGASDGRVFVAGEEGYLARLAGDRLERLDLPTSARITSILPMADGRLFLTGAKATAMLYGETGARLVDAGERRAIFFNAVELSDTVLIAADTEVLAYDAARATLSRHSVVSSHRLVASHGALWSLGHTVGRWEGRGWSPLAFAGSSPTSRTRS